MPILNLVPRAAIIPVLLVLNLFFQTAAWAAAKDPVSVTGPVDKLVDLILRSWNSKEPPVIRYRLQTEKIDKVVTVQAYHSDYSAHVVYKNNCVASGWEMIVDCDLKLVDDLIARFYLLADYSGKSKVAARLRYRQSLLMWILSHEFGHIALNHGRSDFDEGLTGFQVFDVAKQQDELDADAYAISVVGNLETGPVAAYSAILDVTNMLMREALCPQTFPNACRAIPAGVGLIFDYTPEAKPIRITLSGSHPAYIARFLRIMYLSGIGTSQNSINYLAKKAIDLLEVETNAHQWKTIRDVFRSD